MSRRSFLRGSSGGLAFMAAAGTLRGFMGEASAVTGAGYAGYRAAVCVFLAGGNDGNNTLVPTTTNGVDGPYDHYKNARPTLAHPIVTANPVLPTDPPKSLFISPTGLAANSYMLHPALKKLQGHFQAGRAAFVCNVGPVVLPTNKALYSTTGFELPRNLFSHSDQQDAWASGIADPIRVALPAALIGKGATGWGGRVADKITSLNVAASGYPDLTSFGGRPLFGVGVTRKPLVASSAGILAFTAHPNAGFEALRRESLLGTSTSEGVMSFTNDVVLEEAYSEVFTSSMKYAATRDAARTAAWALIPAPTRDAIDALFVPPADVKWTLHTQLYQVIRDLVAGATAVASGGLGLRREIFSVGFGSFDTHDNQLADQAAKLDELDFAIDAFQQAMTLLAPEMGATPPQTTLFTMSDFSRTLKENSGGGTDHAWGNHMIVLGTQVAGKKLYGKFPSLDITTKDLNDNLVNQETVDAKGRFIPAVSVEQYANGIAYWLGLNLAGERDYAFPNLDEYIAAASDTVAWPSALYRQTRTTFMKADA